MNAIAAVDASWGIGREGSLLVSIPEDMKFFRETTKGHTVLMGRKTLESFPGGRPLKKRVNVVLSGTEDEREEMSEEGTLLVYRKTLERALAFLNDIPSGEVFVIGGGSVYRELLPFCDRAYITRLDRTFEADTFFPDLDADPAWTLKEKGEEKEYEGIRYCFCLYERVKSGI